jgi:hypothetical protein
VILLDCPLLQGLCSFLTRQLIDFYVLHTQRNDRSNVVVLVEGVQNNNRHSIDDLMCLVRTK